MCEVDRVRILNSIIGRSYDTASPPQEHPQYEEHNIALRWRIGTVLYLAARRQGPEELERYISLQFVCVPL